MPFQIGLPEFEYKTGEWQSVANIAKLFGISERTIRDWIKAGIISKPLNRMLNLEAVIRGVYRHQRKLIEGTGSFELTEERTKREGIKRQLEEIELKEKLNQVVMVEHVISSVTKLLFAIKTKLLWVPRKVAQLVPDVSSEADRERILKDQIYDILREMENYDTTQFGSAFTETQRDNGDNGSAAGTDDQSVGREIPVH